MQLAAQETGLANDGKKAAPNQNALSPDTAWVSSGAQSPGNRFMLSVTDSASAVRYGLQTANLSQAGDDAGTSRSFIAADQAGFLAGQKAMVPSSVTGVLQPHPGTVVPGAYPLTMVTYAAATPRSLDASARHDYASVVSYAAGKGQIPGVAYGNLPPGYAPLPPDLVKQTAAAATLIASGDPAPAVPATSSSSPPATSTPTKSPSSSGPATGTAGVIATGAPTGTGATSANRAIVFTSPPPAGPRTGFFSVGVLRYTLPVLVFVGILAAIGAGALSKKSLRTAQPGIRAASSNVNSRLPNGER
jgi:hypothetical protein